MSKRKTKNTAVKSSENKNLKAQNQQPQSEKESHILDSFAGTIEAVNTAMTTALDEDIIEIDETAAEITPETDKKEKKSHKLYFALTIFVLVMAIVGVINTITFSAQLFDDLKNKTALKNEFAVFLYPAVVNDIPTFEAVEDLPSSSMISCSIWNIIIKGTTELYASDGKYMTIPAIDVESSAHNLFGASITFTHQTVGDVEQQFIYSETDNSYTVPVNLRLTSYSPRVIEVSNVGELFTVTVEYIPPMAFAIEGIEHENDPDKTMIFTVSRSNDSKTIRSLQYQQVKDGTDW